MAALPADINGKQSCLYNNTFFSNCGQSSSAYASAYINSSNMNSNSASSVTSAFSSFSLDKVSGLFLVY